MRDGRALTLAGPAVTAAARPAVRASVWRWGRFAAVLVALLLLPLPALAHLMPVEQGTVNVVGNRVYVVLAMPSGVFEGVDDDDDGQVSPAEIGFHQAALTRQALGRVRLTDGGRPGVVGLVSVISPQTGDEAISATPYVLLLLETSFQKPPSRLAITADVFGSTAGAGQITVNARRGEERELIVLNAGKTTHVFFRSPGAVFLDFVQTGLVHILSGFDHLLFLLTMIAARGATRRWFSSITVFTAAHSVTLLLGGAGIVNLPASVVEPLIALSISAMAASNLSGLYGESPRLRLGIIFACGLLHGLGFASALDDFGLGFWRKTASLLGFNVGIEIGQALVLVALALLLAGSRGLFARMGETHRPDLKLFSLAALVGGVFLFLHRIL